VSVFLIGQRRSLDCPGLLKGHFETCCNELRLDEHCGATRDLKCAEFESLTSFQRSTWRQMPKGTLSGDLAHRRAGPTLTSHARTIDELYLSWALGIISGLNSLVRVAAKGTYMDDDAMKRLLSQYCEELLVKRPSRADLRIGSVAMERTFSSRRRKVKVSRNTNARAAPSPVPTRIGPNRCMRRFSEAAEALNSV